MKKSEAIQVYKLIKQWTRAEVCSRLGPFGAKDSADFFQIKLDKENEIRELLYGTSSLVELDEKLGVLKKCKKISKTKCKKR